MPFAGLPGFRVKKSKLASPASAAGGSTSLKDAVSKRTPTLDSWDAYNLAYSNVSCSPRSIGLFCPFTRNTDAQVGGTILGCLFLQGQLNFEHPPLPPFPLESGAQYFAPLHRDEDLRQDALDHLQLDKLNIIRLGHAASGDVGSPTLSVSSSITSGSTPSVFSDIEGAGTASPASTFSQPIGTSYSEPLQRLVEAARTRFKTTVSIISVSDHAKHIFQAESGLSAISEMCRYVHLLPMPLSASSAS